MRLSAIVVAFGKERVLGACLSRLDRALASVDGHTELIVVINDLPADARRRLRTRLPAVVVVEGSPELGFAGAIAAGLEVAVGEWIALVNDDCMVEPDALDELLAAGERNAGVGSVAAQICFAGDEATVNSAGIEVDELGVARER